MFGNFLRLDIFSHPQDVHDFFGVGKSSDKNIFNIKKTGPG